MTPVGSKPSASIVIWRHEGGYDVSALVVSLPRVGRTVGVDAMTRITSDLLPDLASIFHDVTSSFSRPRLLQTAGADKHSI